jgi:transcriptional regulator with XRE-family HTH domain
MNRESIQAADQGLIERIRQRRTTRFGPRGRADFAAALGIRPSSYHYYETDRVPPPALLVKMAQVTQTDLVWLLTGEGSPDIVGRTSAIPGSKVIQRVAGLLEQRPGAGRAMAAFTELLENIQAVEQKRQAARRASDSGPAVATPAPRSRKKAAPKADPETPPPLRSRGRAKPNPAWKTTLQPGRLIPVLGRAAAASPQFWVSLIDGEGLSDPLTAAVEHLRAGKWEVAQVGSVGPYAVRGSVALVQLADPVELAGLSVHEMLESQWVAKRWPGAFALRVDGDSMQPTLQPNDLVVLSPKRPAADGEPAVVQLAGQIGVTCKIYRHAGDKVRLIPANPEYPTSVHAVRDVVWALQVLARVRVGKADKVTG